jgi:hypothetical protein
MNNYVQTGGGQVVPSVQTAVQCVLTVADKQCCHVDLMNKRVWLTGGYATQFQDAGF